MKSKMLKQVLTAVFTLTALVVLTGCQNTRDYSVRSYQGPLPVTDHVFVNSQ
jgi:hypothetical protein